VPVNLAGRHKDQRDQSVIKAPELNLVAVHELSPGIQTGLMLPFDRGLFSYGPPHDCPEQLYSQDDQNTKESKQAKQIRPNRRESGMVFPNDFSHLGGKVFTERDPASQQGDERKIPQDSHVVDGSTA
jgi:hypothetical protein